MNVFDHDYLLDELENFSKEEKNQVRLQLKRISWLDVLEQRRVFAERGQKQTFDSYFQCPKAGQSSWKIAGEKCLAKNMVATIILAAGDGSRFQTDNPKGTFEIFPDISLFHIFAKKILQAQDTLHFVSFVIILTSQKNHDQTVQFFKAHNYFSLQKKQVHFFPISSLPLMDGKGKWFWQSPGKLATGPTGNGQVFYTKEVLSLLKKYRVDYITVIQVENPLADPLDTELIGYAFEKKLDIVLKCFQRDDPNEKTGILAMKGEELRLIEYVHADKTLFSNTGLKKYPYANVGNYCFSLSFFERMSRMFLPFHLQRKKAQKYGKGPIDVLKCERFIFDALYYTGKSGCICYPKDKCYAPLKDRSQIPMVQSLLKKEGIHSF